MNVNLTAPINFLSYGLVSLNLMKSLTKLGHKVSWWPIGGKEAEPENHELLRNCIKNAELFDNEAPSLRIFHQFNLAQHVGKGLRVGFPIFELTRFNKVELHHLASQDVLCVCSHWAKRVIEDNSINVPTFVVPLGVDTDIFYPSETRQRSKEVVFLNIGKIEYRKSHDVLLECFANAFDNNEDVQLWMMWENPFISGGESKEWERAYSNRLGDRVKFIKRVSSSKEVANIMRSVDCGVFPSRGEGWNLPLLEMLACGKPVIATNYSAHTEFCNIDNCKLIEIDELEPAFDGLFFKDVETGGQWAKFGESQKGQLIEELRDVYTKIKEGKNFNNFGMPGIETARRFSWENSVKQLVIALNGEK